MICVEANSRETQEIHKNNSSSQLFLFIQTCMRAESSLKRKSSVINSVQLLQQKFFPFSSDKLCWVRSLVGKRFLLKLFFGEVDSKFLVLHGSSCGEKI